MRKVIPFKNKKIFGTYNDVSNNGGAVESSLFIAGVIVSMLMPATVYCILGGPVSPTAFAVVALSGLVWGLEKYRRQQALSIYRLGTGALPRAPRNRGEGKKAA
jgi:hypothetical protein